MPEYTVKQTLSTYTEYCLPKYTAKQTLSTYTEYCLPEYTAHRLIKCESFVKVQGAHFDNVYGIIFIKANAILLGNV